MVRPQLEQFEIHRMVPATTLGYDVSFTNASLFMVLTLIGVWAFLTLGMRRATIVPGRWQSAVEMIHEFVQGMVDENIGASGRRYVPFIFALFIFILFANILGLLPFAFAVTSHIWVTFAFAAFIFLLCIAIGFARHGLKFFTLSVRLFANMTAGHILLQVFAGFVVSLGLAGGAFWLIGILPLVMNVALYALELLVAVVQAYVFALLTCVYLNDSINLPH